MSFCVLKLSDLSANSSESNNKDPGDEEQCKPNIKRLRNPGKEIEVCNKTLLSLNLSPLPLLLP